LKSSIPFRNRSSISELSLWLEWRSVDDYRKSK
jgi:hypothetical protein